MTTDINTKPCELGLGRLVNLDMEADFIGKAALHRIQKDGPSRKQVGLIIDCAPLKGPNTTFRPITKYGDAVGKVTSAVYAPRLGKKHRLGHGFGAEVEVVTHAGPVRATIVERPF